MTEADRIVMREIAEHAAKCAVRETMKALGIDMDKPDEVQRDFHHLRAWRDACDTARRTGIKTAVGILVTGILGALWLVLKQRLGSGP